LTRRATEHFDEIEGISYFEAPLLKTGGKAFDRWITPFTWVCNFCSYPRRINEMISTDDSEPCVFCMQKLLNTMFRGGGKITRVVPSVDGLSEVDAGAVGINSADVPEGRGGDDSELLVDWDGTVYEGAQRRYVKKIEALRRIMSHVNGLTGADVEGSEKRDY
jgi:hypothetical protein